MPVLPTKAAWARVQRAVRVTEQSRPGDFSPRRRPESANYPLRVILLDDCDAESPVDAIVTEIEDTNEIQKLTIEGEPSGGTFRLTFSGKQTPPLAWNITPTNLEIALEALESIGKDGVSVTLGPPTPQRPGVYLIEFTGRLEATDVPLLEVTDNLTGVALMVAATTIWADTGDIIQVRNAIPVGTPTPLRAGAVCLVVDHGTAGYVIHAAEARPFNPYGS